MADSANWLVRRRLRWPVVIAMFAVLLTLASTSTAAYADPDPEGGNQSLSEKLEAAARSYYDTKAVLSASQARQAEIEEKLRFSEMGLDRLTAEIGRVAGARYKGSQIGVLNGLITGEGDPKVILQGAAVADYLVWRDDSYLRLYRTTKDEAEKQRKLLNAELEIQAKQLADLDSQKREAEKALASAGGMVTTGYNGPVPDAQPAPRNADGTLPREGCSIDDPTHTGGCLTPRMFHTLNEARLAGYLHFSACWRAADWGEHPSGRACDLAAAPNSFGAYAASGADKDYGDRLAAWAVKNAEALGIMYVIWYRQIYMVGSRGWAAYNSYGDASTEHTNHVHISVL